MTNLFEKTARYYKAAAVIFLNICIVLFFFNVGLLVISMIKEDYFSSKRRNNIAHEYDYSLLRKVYNNSSEEEIRSLLKETWSRPYIFEPYTLFKERPYKGRYVNVSENGFRISKGQGPWPPNEKNMNIFMFGGSTTFGYGVADEQTIASYLYDFLLSNTELPIKVYNFGRGSYYSEQERILFQNLLISGIVPDVAVFVDGFNDIYLLNEGPAFSERIRRSLVDENQEQTFLSSLRLLINKLPMYQLVKIIKEKMANSISNNPATDEDIGRNDAAKVSSEEPHDLTIDDKKIENVINSYQKNIKMIEAIADRYDVKSVYVWQPVHAFKYDIRYHLFAAPGVLENYLHKGYTQMEKVVKSNVMGNKFLWLGHIQENIQRPLYVDKVHYSADMSRTIAAHIGEMLLKRGILNK